MGAGEHAPARGLGVGLAGGEQLSRERARRGALARAGRAMEELGVRGLARAQRGAQHHPRVRVALGALEHGLGAHAGAPARAASTARSTSAWTSSGERAASIRTQRSGSASANRS